MTIGFDWGSFGKDVFGGVHVAGRVVATAFGGAQLADAAEGLENQGGLLPSWAKKGGAADVVHIPEGSALTVAQASKGAKVAKKGSSAARSVATADAPPSSKSSSSESDLLASLARFTTASAQNPDHVVRDPDFVGVVPENAKKGDYPPWGTAGVGFVVGVWGGKRFEGNGYKTGDYAKWNGEERSRNIGKNFSFGYDSPSRVDIINNKGKKLTLTDVKQILFAGGNEPEARVVAGQEETEMEDLSALGKKILGDLGEAVEGCSEVLGDDVGSMRGAYVLGAAAAGAKVTARGVPRASIMFKQSPLSGRLHTAIAVTKTKRRSDATSIKNAKDVGKRAVDVGQRILKQLAASQAKAKVHGIGAAPVRRGALSPAQVKRLAEDAIKAGKDVIARADKHTALVDSNKKRIDKGKAASKEKMKPRTGASIRGYEDDPSWDEIVGEADAARAACEVLGDIDFGTHEPDFGTHTPDFGVLVGDPPPIPDPFRPGLMTDGSPDPAYGGSVPADPYGSGGGGSAPAAPTYTAPGPDTNYGLGPAPTLAAAKAAFLEPGTFEQEAPGGEQTTYYSLPAGAIPFTFDRSPPFKAICSYNTFHKNPQAPGGQDSNGVGAGFEWHGDAGSRWWVYWPDNGSTNNVVPPNAQEAADLDVMYDAGIAKNWGPLIGNPTMKDWAGLRYLHDGSKTWFWFRESAPDWASAPELQKLLNQMVLDYNTQLTAAKQNYAAQVAQDALDAKTASDTAKAQAREDAEIARRQQLESTESMHQADLQAQQQASQFAQLDVQQAQLQQQMMQQQLAERQQMMEFYRQNPQAMMQPMPEEQGWGGNPEDNVDWGDSEPPVPASDLEEDV